MGKNGCIMINLHHDIVLIIAKLKLYFRDNLDIFLIHPLTHPFDHPEKYNKDIKQARPKLGQSQSRLRFFLEILSHFDLIGLYYRVKSDCLNQIFLLSTFVL